ncbi:PQQ-dependent sugar dehydrogenase, partial [Escherichia coli]|nr:PQQ-dependent sugar dehydrogenase [Escherichia coli]
MQKSLRLALPALALLAACNAGSELSARQTAAPAADGELPFAMTRVAAFDAPWAMAFLPDGRMLVTEKAGRILLVSADGRQRQVIANVDVVFQGQGG